MNIKEQNWFSCSINQEAKSYLILYIDWDNYEMKILNRFEGNYHNDNTSTKQTGKAFIEIGNGNFDDDLFIKNGDNGTPTIIPYEDEYVDVLEMPKWSDHKEEIIKLFVENKK